MQYSPDAYDLKLIDFLSRKGRASWVDCAAAVNLSPSACQRRVQALEKAGVIRGYMALVDQSRLGRGLRAFVDVKMDRKEVKSAGDFRQRMRALPQVLACYKLSGSVDFRLDVVADSISSFSDFIENVILTLPGVADASSSIILEEVKP